jgi:hypothetical protein
MNSNKRKQREANPSTLMLEESNGKYPTIWLKFIIDYKLFILITESKMAKIYISSATLEEKERNKKTVNDALFKAGIDSNEKVKI